MLTHLEIILRKRSFENMTLSGDTEGKSGRGKRRETFAYKRVKSIVKGQTLLGATSDIMLWRVMIAEDLNRN